MAANQVDKNKKIYKNCPKAILNVVPKEVTKITFEDLVPGEGYENKAIIGKISHLYPLGKRADGETRKILIIDALNNSENNDTKLPVFLFDQYAKDSETVENESYIIITNFKVQNNPNRKADVPVVVSVKRGGESQVWFARKINKEARKKSAAPSRSKKQKVSSDGEDAHAVSVLHYNYTKLGDLTESESYYNVYGIVDKCDLKVAQGKKSKFLDLSLIDETEASFSCTIFAGDEDTFPDVYPGDVVRVHRMQVYKFRNKLRGKCANPKFILVFSKHNEGDKPRTVAKTFTFEAEDLSRARQLLQWNKTKNDPKLICDIQKGDFVNIICQVVGVYVAKTEAVILKIWDGTKTNVFPGVHLGFKEEKIDQTLFTIARSYYVNLFVYGQHIGPAAELEPGKYIEVQDAHLYSSNYNPEEAKLTLHAGNKEGRGIFILNEDDERVLQLKERLEKIISDVLEFGSQTTDLLSQNNSIFLNCDISVFNSQPPANGDHGGEHCEPEAREELCVENRANEEVPAENEGGENIPSINGADAEIHAENAANEEIPADNRANEEMLIEDNADEVVSTNLDLLNRPLHQDNNSQDKTVVSVVDASIKPGQSTQEFGGMQRGETSVPDDENRIPVAGEPDPMCNLTPLQTRYFFHDPQRSSSQLTDSIFPTYTSNSDDDEWWNSVPTVSVTDQHSDVKPTRLNKVVQHDVPNQFRVLAAVFCFKPNTSSIEKFIHLYCSKCNYISDVNPPLVSFETRDGLAYYFCPVCKDEENPEHWPVLQYTFMLSLSLHDGSSSIETYLWKKNAVKFFKGITPEEALKDSAIADSILHMLWNICPNCKPFNFTVMEHSAIYPMLDCCIFSYVSENRTKYQIFDTILI